MHLKSDKFEQVQTGQTPKKIQKILFSIWRSEFVRTMRKSMLRQVTLNTRVSLTHSNIDSNSGKYLFTFVTFVLFEDVLFIKKRHTSPILPTRVSRSNPWLNLFSGYFNLDNYNMIIDYMHISLTYKLSNIHHIKETKKTLVKTTSILIKLKVFRYKAQNFRGGGSKKIFFKIFGRKEILGLF